MTPSDLLQSKRFQKDFRKLDKRSQRQVNNVILNEILYDPSNFTLMRYEYAGIREVRLERNLRILFSVCDECRELRSKLKRCIDCEETGAGKIKLLTVFYHKKKYPKLF